MNGPDLMMLVDVVDRSNRPIGTSARRDLLPENKNFRTAHAILATPDNEAILLQLLPSDHPRSPGKLGSSVAGYVKAGETYTSAVHRKIDEELGLPKHTALADIGEVTMNDEGSTKFVGVFAGRLHDAPRFNPDEVAALVFLPITTLD